MNNINKIQDITLQQFDLLIKELPWIERYGGTLFLGKHYAKNNILMLGINPGIDAELPLDVDLRAENCLMMQPDPPTKIRYWNNASIAFNATSELSQKMNDATFSFCSPFRTPRWSQSSKQEKDIIMECSKPVFSQLIKDCKPEVIIVAGQTSINILYGYYSNIITSIIEIEGTATRFDRSHNWAEYSAEIAHNPIKIIRSPHFSIANNHEKLWQFGVWLSEKV